MTTANVASNKAPVSVPDYWSPTAKADFEYLTSRPRRDSMSIGLAFSTIKVPAGKPSDPAHIKILHDLIVDHPEIAFLADRDARDTMYTNFRVPNGGEVETRRSYGVPAELKDRNEQVVGYYARLDIEKFSKLVTEANSAGYAETLLKITRLSHDMHEDMHRNMATEMTRDRSQVQSRPTSGRISRDNGPSM